MLKRIAVVSGSGRGIGALKTEGEKRGILVGSIKEGEAIPPATAGLLVATGSDFALDAAESLADRNTKTLFLLAEAIDCRESFTPGSSQRVMELATQFARALSLSTGEEITLERGALLRDIGKLRIPNEVLLKTSVLTYDEWNLLHQHTSVGAELVRSFDEFADLEEIVHRHHECFDGDGYPDKLEGEAIPLLARIVKIVDVYCAMTSARHYRPGSASREEALQHLKDERGKHFDPELINVFLDKKLADTEPTK